MGNYTGIAETGEKIIELLQRELVPEVLQNPNEIGLRSPEEYGDAVLGVFLYDIKESEEIRQQAQGIIRNERIRRPPIYLNLFYAITVYSKAEVRYRSQQEQSILGKVIQTFHDYPILPLKTMSPGDTEGIDLRIQMLRLTVDEKSKIWSFPNMGNRLSLFYKVSPIAIDAGSSSEFTRVTDLDITITAMAGERV